MSASPGARVPYIRYFRRALWLPILLPVPVAIAAFFVGGGASWVKHFALSIVSVWMFMLVPYVLFAAVIYRVIGRSAVARVRMLLWLGPCICLALYAIGMLLLRLINGRTWSMAGWASDASWILQAAACGYACVILIEMGWLLQRWSAAEDQGQRRLIVKHAWRYVLVIAALGGLWEIDRNFISCVWLARDMTGLTLRGNIHAVACEHGVTESSVTLALDSAAYAVAAASAARDPRFKPIPLTADSLPHLYGILGNLAGKKGWYYGPPDRSNGGFIHILLDSGAKTLSAKSAWF